MNNQSLYKMHVNQFENDKLQSNICVCFLPVCFIFGSQIPLVTYFSTWWRWDAVLPNLLKYCNTFYKIFETQVSPYQILFDGENNRLFLFLCQQNIGFFNSCQNKILQRLKGCCCAQWKEKLSFVFTVQRHYLCISSQYKVILVIVQFSTNEKYQSGLLGQFCCQSHKRYSIILAEMRVKNCSFK